MKKMYQMMIIWSALLAVGVLIANAQYVPRTLNWAIEDGIWDDVTTANWTVSGNPASDVPQAEDTVIITSSTDVTVDFESAALGAASPLKWLRLGGGAGESTLLVTNQDCVLAVTGLSPQSGTQNSSLRIDANGRLRLDHGAMALITAQNWHDSFYTYNGGVLSITNATLKMGVNGHYYLGGGGSETPAIVRIGQGGVLHAEGTSADSSVTSDTTQHGKTRKDA